MAGAGIIRVIKFYIAGAHPVNCDWFVTDLEVPQGGIVGAPGYGNGISPKLLAMRVNKSPDHTLRRSGRFSSAAGFQETSARKVSGLTG